LINNGFKIKFNILINIINVNQMEDYQKTVKDATSNRIIRKSALTRITIGTLTCTGLCFLYAISHAKYRHLDYRFIGNWVKGSLVFSFGFYSLNEALWAGFKYYNLYTNYWINYSLSAYYLSKVYYRYLIRNHIMPWYTAIKTSHKYFLYLCVFNLIIESLIYIKREIELYDEEDIIDIWIKKRNSLNDTDDKIQIDSYDELEAMFRKPIHIFNSKKKKDKLIKYMKEKDDDSNVIDLYEFFKEGKF
jgi:hypothetical protein